MSVVGLGPQFVTCRIVINIVLWKFGRERFVTVSVNRDTV